MKYYLTVTLTKFDTPTCFKEAGDIIIRVNSGEISESHFYAELGGIITDKKPAWENDAEITLYKSNGLAIQDAATAKLVYDEALEACKGISVEI